MKGDETSEKGISSLLLIAMSMVSGNYISDIKNEKSMDNSLSHPCPCILVYLIYSNRVLSW